MNNENEMKVSYTCKHLCNRYYCKLSSMKPTGSIADDILGRRLCIQPMPAEHKRGIKCNKKSLVEVKQEVQ